MKTTQRYRWPAILFGILISLVGAQHVRANAPQGQYTTTNGTVYDTKTKLTWERGGMDVEYTFAEADSYCKSLQTEGPGWRLASMKELMTIVDDTRTYPAIDVNAFPNIPVTGYWSSSLKADKPGEAWTIHFSTGQTQAETTSTPRHVRCVR